MSGSGEVRKLIVGEKYSVTGGEKPPCFTVEPCVGGFHTASQVQLKWRVRYEMNHTEEGVFVVMTGIPFLICGNKFVIKYNDERKPGKITEEYDIYSIS